MLLSVHSICTVEIVSWATWQQLLLSTAQWSGFGGRQVNLPSSPPWSSTHLSQGEGGSLCGNLSLLLPTVTSPLFGIAERGHNSGSADFGQNSLFASIVEVLADCLVLFIAAVNSHILRSLKSHTYYLTILKAGSLGAVDAYLGLILESLTELKSRCSQGRVMGIEPGSSHWDTSPTCLIFYFETGSH